MLNGIKGKLNDDIMIVTGVTGGEIVSWFYPLLICSDFRYIIISIESLDGCLFSVLGISNRRKNGLKWAFVSIKFGKNTYFNCAFMPCFALESDLQN